MARGKSRTTLDLIRACYEILDEIQPATVRAVCYRLFTQGLIASMAKANTNRVSHHLTQAREDGEIPWPWVVDETREPERPNTWRNPAAYVAAVRRSYRRDHWVRPARPGRGLVARRARSAARWRRSSTSYGVTFRVMHGYASATVVHQDPPEPPDRPAAADRPVRGGLGPVGACT